MWYSNVTQQHPRGIKIHSVNILHEIALTFPSCLILPFSPFSVSFLETSNAKFLLLFTHTRALEHSKTKDCLLENLIFHLQVVSKAKLINLLLFAVFCSIIIWHRPVKLLVKGCVMTVYAFQASVILQRNWHENASSCYRTMHVRSTLRHLLFCQTGKLLH